MAIVKFGKVETVGSSGLTTGKIYFETSTGLIKVAKSATAVDVFGGNIKDATYSNNILTITKQTGGNITLNFSDIASASSVMAVFDEVKEELARVEEKITTEVNTAKSALIGSTGDSSSMDTINAAKKYTDEKVAAIPAAVTYKGDGTTITQSGSDTVTFSVGSIAQSKVSGLTDALAGKAAASHTHTKAQITDFDDTDYATAAQGTKADTALQSITAAGSGNLVLSAAAKSGTTQEISGSITTSTITSGGSGLVTASDAKSYIASQISAAQVSALKYKGSCTYAELPESPAQGDVWNVTDKHDNVPAGTNYAWDGEAWDPLAGAVDLSPYLLSSTAASTYATQAALTSGLAGKANTVHTHAVTDVTGLQDALDGKADSSDLSGYVPTSRTVNGKPLSSNVTISGADVLVGGDGDHAADSVATAIAELEDAIAAKPSTDTNTTYTFTNGADGSFTVTPSSGSAQTVTIGKPATAGRADTAATADKVGHSLTISLNGTAQTAFTGASAVSFNITAASVGADAAGAASNAEQSAKEYADSLMTWEEFE